MRKVIVKNLAIPFFKIDFNTTESINLVFNCMARDGNRP